MAAEARGPRVAVRTLGCKVNRAESDAIGDELLAAGAALADEAEADVIVINSCTVTGEADAKTRKEVRRALAAPGAPIVVVTGCMAALQAPELASLGDRVVVEPDKARVAERVLARGLRVPAPPAQVLGSRVRVAVKVQDGCDDRCTYCIVPDARGGPRSVPVADVIERVSRLAADGIAEVVLTGVNIGRYHDAGGTDLAQLVERIAATGIRRIRISSIEPVDLTPVLLATLAATPSVMPHLHVPLQSGRDRTLAAMRRPYDTAVFADLVARARQALPGLAVTTDVIVGFPGETDEDFQASLAFVERMAFTRLHVFRYSKRPGTPAATMPGHVDPRVSAARAEAMRTLAARLADAHARSRVGGEASVLIERVASGGAVGTSEDYLRVRLALAPQGTRPGHVVPVRLTSAEHGGAVGTAVAAQHSGPVRTPRTVLE